MQRLKEMKERFKELWVDYFEIAYYQLSLISSHASDQAISLAGFTLAALAITVSLFGTLKSLVEVSNTILFLTIATVLFLLAGEILREGAGTRGPYVIGVILYRISCIIAVGAFIIFLWSPLKLIQLEVGVVLMIVFTSIFLVYVYLTIRNFLGIPKDILPKKENYEKVEEKK